MNEGKAENTEGEVCPNEAESAQIGPQRAARRQKARPIGRKRSSWSQDGVHAATIWAGFRDHLGNVGLIPMNLFVIALLGMTAVKGQELSEASPTGLTPVYPVEPVCSPITSPFGSTIDLDGSQRDEPHDGIDLGNLGDVVAAPADGIIRAVWRVEHEWGDDWNVLIVHTPADLNLPESPLVYFTELDHLQIDDMAHLMVGKRLRRGDRIGVVHHPGNNARFRAEVHMEVHEVPADRQNEVFWRNDLGFRYWLSPSAILVDPLSMLALHQEKIVQGKVNIVPFQQDGDYRRFKGFTYPLFCQDKVRGDVPLKSG